MASVETAPLTAFGRPALGATGARRSFAGAKAAIDFSGAATLLLLSAPLLVIAALAVKLSSRGPILYVQKRVGRGGRVFTMLKFRTMVHEAEARTGPVWAREDDPRVTWVGRLLRRTHVDELPQLINVLRGEMSLVGPRPERPIFVKIFSASIPRYRKRHLVKPGITGLAQVHHKYDETVADVKKKLAYDLFYVRRMCWLVDLAVIWATLGRVIRGEIR